MPANLRDLRSRIKSVKNTQQITKAMKLVSAAKFGRAQTAVLQARPYSAALARLAGRLMNVMPGEEPRHPLLKPSDSNVVAVLVISSERGLCAGYNANIAKLALKTIEELQAEGKTVSVTCIGKKAFQVLVRRRGVLPAIKAEPRTTTQEAYVASADELLLAGGLVHVTTPFDKPSFDMVSGLAEGYAKLYEEGKIGKLVLVYNKFQSAMTQIPTAESALPVVAAGTSTLTAAEPVFEPDADQLLATIVPRYLANRLLQTLLEAVASEQGARMSAMDSATRNAKDMERKLQVTYQRARQAAITNELIEIISGAEAL